MKHDRNDGRLQGGGTVDREIDRPGRFSLKPVTEPAEGAVAALKQANRKDVRIHSYDATPAGLQLVKDGYIVADIQNGRAAQATQAIEAAQAVVAGDLTLDDPQLVPAAFFIVTTENVAQYEKDFPAAFTEEGV